MSPQYLFDGFDFCLAHAVEECGEFLAAAGKLQRFGPASSNPELPVDKQETNLTWLERELSDLEVALIRLKMAIGREFVGGDRAALASGVGEQP